MKTVCVHGYISGKVQGVWFRGSTQQQAESLGVTGWAKNLPDGRVEVMLYGREDAVESLRIWLRKGPPMAEVSLVDLTIIEADPTVGFKVL